MHIAPLGPSIMSEVADARGTQHRLSDWLALHRLDAGTCRRILGTIAARSANPPEPHQPRPSPFPPIGLDAAWRGTVAALCDFFPCRADLIQDIFARTEKILVDQPAKSRKAVTLDNGPAAHPTILFSYRGEPRDWLVMAHEFGHAVQIRASQGKLVPPILREMCAFIGEAALLSYAMRHDRARHASLASAWHKDGARYLGVQSAALEAALTTPDEPYRYAWNYPFARYFAVETVDLCPRDWIWRTFTGEVTVQDVVQLLDRAGSTKPLPINP